MGEPCNSSRTERRLDRHRRDHIGRAQQPFGARQRQDTDRKHALCAVDEREPFLRLELERSEPCAAQRIACRLDAVRREEPTPADQGQGETCERREVARGTERASLGHRGDEIAVQHVHHAFHDLHPNARVPERQHVRA
jgi:hypothetical protein